MGLRRSRNPGGELDWGGLTPGVTMLMPSTVLAVLSIASVVLVQVREGEIPDGLSARDWTSIRAAHDAEQHAVHEVEGGYQARNPGQQWTTRYDQRGFTVKPDAGDWTWGLELVRYGFADMEQEVTRPECTRAQGRRVAYTWGETLEEWYVNGRRGLEHGFTVHRRPEREGEGDYRPLVLALAVRGGLRPEVAADGRGAQFVDEKNGVALTYAGLRVFDADGRDLDASLERAPLGIRISVDERGARYPVTIDPIVQQAYLKASNTAIGTVFICDLFGYSVSVSGDTVVVGAPAEDSNATGVNGSQFNDNAQGSGAAYVFVHRGGIWSQEAYLKASNTDPFDSFGIAVAVSGDTIVVGATGEESAATGVNGDQGDNSIAQSGAAYVFVRSGTTWSQQAYLKASNTGSWEGFGRTLAADGDTAVVGAYAEDSSATGVNGDQSDNSAQEAGAAYVFLRTGTTWTQQAYLKASNTDADDWFSYAAVAIDGDTLVIGAGNESSSATGVNGDQGDNSADSAGAAYVYVRAGSTWTQEAYLKASNTASDDWFGGAVAVSGDTIVCGAPGEDSSATGVGGDQNDDSMLGAGAAYVFVRTGTSWNQQAYLKASNSGYSDLFGEAVAMSGNTVVIGAYGEDSNALGVNGDQNNDGATESGAAYVFVRDGTSWSQRAYLKASNTEYRDWFSHTAVSVSGGTIVVGASDEDSSARGVNGNQGDNGAYQAGAAYVFHLDVPAAACSWYCASATNMDTYAVSAPYVIGGTFQGTVGFSTPNTGAVIAGYLGRLTFPIWGQQGLVDVGTPEVMGLPSAIGTSPVTITWPVPNVPAYAGYHVYTQAAGFGGGQINLTCAFDCTVGF